MRWTAEQVLDLAPDAASAKAGRSQASPAKWPSLGASAHAVWGACQGSGKAPYQVGVDLSEPAFKCSCPSRKFPCKHALGLLLLWADGAVPESDEPEWVDTWLARPKRAESSGERDEEAAARRAEKRASRVAGGAAELIGWLGDQVTTGLAVLDQSPDVLYAVAARMVDAQAPGLASGLRRAAMLPGRGRDWPSRLLEDLALLRTLAVAYARIDDLPAPLAATVRTRLGFTVDTADVLASGDRVRDEWLVAGHVDQENDQLVSRRTWLRGSASGRWALVLSFAGPGRILDTSLVSGTLVPATLAFYPGALPLRALVADRDDAVPAPVPSGGTVDDALAAFAAGLALDPWLDRLPVVLHDVSPVSLGKEWGLSSVDGSVLPLGAGVDPWTLLAVSGGRPLTVAAELSVSGLRPLSCWDGERAVRL
ncbi:SWIM zinc finger [Actinokineospora alba]|uniref:SWIM zinc finger n=1 Tax=Actinokineospora alba TaxID=504798 RepID=A0A1H0W6G5_9PSEU|nr:SWIM zinc finger family protein [Actinokineospora alba]TDP70026.1 SWIM zinc finger protein [Actinokineospora alba]SDJ49657.1 SWIM zinc finger [Actinokineospora alba]SDP86330.1 SWIM zinc finger [Actinokineospora alba]